MQQDPIRPALPADEAAIRACAHAAYGQYVTAIGRKPAPMEADFPAQIAAGHVHVAKDATGALLGYVVFFPEAGHMHLEAVAVTPAATGKGVGRQLIRHCEEAARRAGLGAVHLYTNQKMTANLSMYPHLGFVEVDRRSEDGFDRVFYEKTVR
ncbi:GNAT family N-acetyltransferase [Paracoccus sp. CPCC 101403]|uniref:GNAT family N-acetyltransferase n=1 Tax=Paracoccus broussonetiae TaxID=3075834 RepID=A0ABU3EH54_9RHOB|nr:GNAT family N-acetyltransferase [Paracoccus sp. CPCC 101403]MDT1063563.1 GNAT family N-acetyltransferase [Paracoccus sp. CPCC 101403]